MAKPNRSRKTPKKSELTTSTLLAGITFGLVMLYFIQSAMTIAEQHPLDTAITNYEQQAQLEGNSHSSQ